MVSYQLIEFFFFKTTLNVFCDESGAYVLTGTEVIKQSYSFNGVVAIWTKSMKSNAVNFFPSTFFRSYQLYNQVSCVVNTNTTWPCFQSHWFCFFCGISLLVSLLRFQGVDVSVGVCWNIGYGYSSLTSMPKNVLRRKLFFEKSFVNNCFTRRHTRQSTHLLFLELFYQVFFTFSE